MAQAPDPTGEAAVLPLDWNFYATDSSVIFRLEPSEQLPYWVEAHAHFGRFNSLPLSVFMTSHQQGLEEGTAVLERVLKELLQRRLPAFWGGALEQAGIELQPSVYYFGIHLKLEPIALADPRHKHLPRRARQQVESILNHIPPAEENDPAIPGAEAKASRPHGRDGQEPQEPSPRAQSPAEPTPAEPTPAEPTAEPAPPAAIAQPTTPSPVPPRQRPAKSPRSPTPSSPPPQRSHPASDRTTAPAAMASATDPWAAQPGSPQASPGHGIHPPPTLSAPGPSSPPGPTLGEPEPAYALAMEDDDILF